MSLIEIFQFMGLLIGTGFMFYAAIKMSKVSNLDLEHK